MSTNTIFLTRNLYLLQMADERNENTSGSIWRGAKKAIRNAWNSLWVSEVTISRNSTTTVTSPSDGSKVIAHMKEFERNGVLQEAVHRVEHIPSPSCPSQERKVWERRFPPTGPADQCDQSPYSEGESRAAVLRPIEPPKKTSSFGSMCSNQ